MSLLRVDLKAIVSGKTKLDDEAIFNEAAKKAFTGWECRQDSEQ